MKNEFYIPSANGRNRIHCIQWNTPTKPKAVLQIVHGMVEHIDRYDDFARFLNQHDIAVIGHSHLGHGLTATDTENLGYFHTTNGSNMVIKDIRRVNTYLHKEYPQTPILLLGHSMGSFFTRKYLTLYGNDLQGVILMGTGYHNFLEAFIGVYFSKFLALIKGPFHRSALLHELIIGQYNRRFSPNRTQADWLSRDTAQVDKYLKDPYCTFRFTVSAYQDFFQIIGELAVKRHFDRIPKTLPMLLISGGSDPVGGNGKGVIKVYQDYYNLGMKDLSLQLYKGARHEILNELNRDKVYQDLLKWIERYV